ncbi:hypothetical protein, partial [Gallibacterium anatis]|uniref:hypothetical protein n=1 Tax=Gallibacterium anatis TaxID=750 RepID=UPI003005B68A
VGFDPTYHHGSLSHQSVFPEFGLSYRLHHSGKSFPQFNHLSATLHRLIPKAVAVVFYKL